MLLKRTLVALVLLPIGLTVIVWGGVAFSLLVTLILALAAYEYVKLFRAGGFQPSSVLVVGGVILLALGRAWDGFSSAPWMISLIIMISMAFHVWAYESGRDQAGSDFGITISGIFYLGWLGSYLISLRNLNEGMWWALLVLPAVWLADTGAYFIGSRFGRHKMAPRLSPKKSWQGYFGGIFVSTIGTALLSLLWGIWTGPDSVVTPIIGAMIGLLLSVITIVGDLGVSMIKRQMGVKDSGNRIDSWIWAAVLGYYLIVWLF